MKILVAIFGKSGTGKDTLINEFCKKYEAHKIIRFTSRPMRPGESDGNPYIFYEDLELNADIVENIDRYLEVGVFNDWIYATREDSLQEGINLGAFDIDAVEQLWNNNRTDIMIVPIYLYCKDKTRMSRQIERSDNLSEMARRFLGDEEKYPSAADEELAFNYKSISSETKIPVKELAQILKINQIQLEEKEYGNKNGRSWEDDL